MASLYDRTGTYLFDSNDERAYLRNADGSKGKRASATPGANWWIAVRQGGKNRCTRIGPDLAEAKAVQARVEADQRARRLRREHDVETQPRMPIPTFNDAADAFI